MESLYSELWGENSLSGIIKEFTIEVPKPQFYREPGFRAGVHDFPLTGILEQKTDQVFQKLETTNRLPCGLKKLLVTKEYIHVENLLRDAELEKWSGGTDEPSVSAKLDVQITGQPGSGKSVFLSYLLVRRLMASQPTVYRDDDDHCFLFDERERGGEVDSEILFKLDEDAKRKLWILTDEALTKQTWTKAHHSWFVVLAASPKKVKASRQWQKDRNVDLRCIRNWNWNDIFAAFSLNNPGVNQTNTAHLYTTHLYTTFTCFGPNARTCLKTIPANSSDGQYDNYVESYLSIVDEEIRQLVGQGDYRYLGSVFDQGTSHTIGLMEPNEHGNGYQIRIITRWIAYRISKVQEGKAKQNSLMLFKSLSSQPTLRTTAGWFFEAYAHDWFGHGGKFQADELPIKDGDPLLEFEIHKSEEINYFTDPRELASQIRVGGGGHGIEAHNLGKYFQPYGKTQESFDGLLFDRADTLILLQYTMAERHEIKTHGVQSLLQELPATIKNIRIIFVVPNDRADNYANPQRVPDADALEPHIRRRLNIKQFRLVFPDENIELLAK